MKCFAISTSDNKFDPFDQFKSWQDFDNFKGYHSCEYLARIAKVSDSLSKQEFEDEIERAIDEIIKYNGVISLDPPVFYIKVTKELQV